MNNCKGEDLECFAWARRRFFLWNDDHHYHRQKSLKVLKLCKGHVEWTGYRMQWQRLHWEGRVRKTQHKKTDEAHWDIGTNRTRIPKTVQFQQKKHHWTNNLCRFDRFRNENAPPLTGNIEQLHLSHTHVRLGDGKICCKFLLILSSKKLLFLFREISFDFTLFGLVALKTHSEKAFL